MNLEALVNDFALRSFRDIGDADYIAARLALRATLVTQFLWASQQAVEKYLKCILLLHRIRATDVWHDLGKALSKIAGSGKLTLNLTRGTEEFVGKLDERGKFRYLEVSIVAFDEELITLDRAVWELRRYCTLSEGPRQATLRDGYPVPRVRLPGGYLEKIVDNASHPAREPLLWQNGFFGKRARRRVRLPGWMQATNAPLDVNPHILDEVLKYVYLPKDVERAYRAHTKP